MNAEEAILTLRKVKAYRPAQVIDEYTAEAWQEAFDDIRFEDALLAVRNLGRAGGDFLEPAKIRVEVQRLIAERRHNNAETKCYTCGGTWEQCSRRYAFEVRNGVADPHEFESALVADRNTADSEVVQRVKAELAHLLDRKNLRNKGVA